MVSRPYLRTTPSTSHVRLTMDTTYLEDLVDKGIEFIRDAKVAGPD